MKGPQVDSGPEREEVLAIVPRDDFEDLRVTIAHYKGRRYADVRVWRVGRGGSARPLPKGIMLRLPELREVIAALRGAEEILAGMETEGDEAA